MALEFDISVTERGRAYNLDSDLSGEVTFAEYAQFTRQVIIETLKIVRKEEEAKGFDKDPRVRTDGVFDRPLELVKPFGRVELFAKLNLTTALQQMYRFIEERSPFVTGQYRSGNYVYVNSQLVARTSIQLNTYLLSKEKTGGFKGNETIRFINVNPYARRLENKGIRRGVRGKFANKNHAAAKRRRTSKKTGKLIVQPNGAYYLSYRLIRSRFKSVAKFIRFTYMPNNTAGVNIQPSGRFRTTFASDGRSYLYPSIVLKLSGQGIQGETIFE